MTRYLARVTDQLVVDGDSIVLVDSTVVWLSAVATALVELLAEPHTVAQACDHLRELFGEPDTPIVDLVEDKLRTLIEQRIVIEADAGDAGDPVDLVDLVDPVDPVDLVEGESR